MVRRIEELNGILNIVCTLPKMDEVVIVARLVQQVFCLFELRGFRPAPFRFLKNFLDIGDALTGCVFCL
jgi:hypothetical protein